MSRPTSTPRPEPAARSTRDLQLLRLAWRGDFDAFKAAYEEPASPPDVNWRDRLPLEIWRTKTNPLRAIDVACFQSVVSQVCPGHSPDGSKRIVLYLLDDKRLDALYINETGTTLLHHAARIGSNEILTKLLELDLKSEVIESRSSEFLVTSAQHGWFPIQELEKDDVKDLALFGSSGSKGVTAIELASYYGHFDIVKVLSETGASVGHAAFCSLRPFLKQPQETLRTFAYILKQDNTPNRIYESNNTILHKAVRLGIFPQQSQASSLELTAGHGQIVERILEWGTDPSLLNSDNESAWDISCAQNKQYLISFFAAREVEVWLKSENHLGTILTSTQRDFIKGYDVFLNQVAVSDAVLIYLVENYVSESNADVMKEKPYLVADALQLIHALGYAMALTKCRLGDMDSHEHRAQLAFCINKHFVKNQADNDELVSREDGIGFERIPRLDQEKRKINADFTSIAFPFLWIKKMNFPENRYTATKFSKDDFKVCVPTNQESISMLRRCFPRSLDEHANPGVDMRKSENRNRDQVLARHSNRKKSNANPVLDLISVCQAWIWKIQDDVILDIPITSGIFHEGLKLGIVDVLSVSGASINYVIGLVLAEVVISLDRPHISGYDEPIFNVFAKEIAGISPRVNSYIDQKNIENISVAEERTFLHEISDIREELSMIQRVVSQQEEIWREFAFNAWPDARNWPYGPDGRFSLEADAAVKEDDAGSTSSSTSQSTGASKLAEIRRRIEKPQYLFPKFKRRLKELDEDAERTERSILIWLDLKQKHLALRETRTMSIMSASVFAFTIITIIFTPLSFATSLFALSVDLFAEDQISLPDKEDPVYRAGYVAKWLVTVEISAFVVTAVTIWIALTQFLGLNTREEAQKIWAIIRGWKGVVTKAQNTSLNSQQVPTHDTTLDHSRVGVDIEQSQQSPKEKSWRKRFKFRNS